MIPTTVILGMVLAVICVLYGIASTRYARKDTVLGVEAGPLPGGDCALPEKKEGSKVIRLTDGRYINTRDYIRIMVYGGCMRPRNILNGEEWLVEPIDKRKPLREQIKERDVLLIYVADKNLYKIREFEGFNEDDSLATFYYEDNGAKHPSSKPHTCKSVCGVVRYAI